MASRVWRWNGTVMVEVSPWAFTKVAVTGQSDVVADVENDVLTLAGGTGVTLTTNASTDTVTVSLDPASSPSFNNLNVGSNGVSGGQIVIRGSTGGLYIFDKNSPYTANSALQRVGDTLTLYGSAAAASWVDGGAMTVYGGLVVSTGSLTISAGALTMTGTLTVNGLIISGGTGNNSGLRFYDRGAANATDYGMWYRSGANMALYSNNTATSLLIVSATTGDTSAGGSLKAATDIYGGGASSSVLGGNVAGFSYISGDRLVVANPQGVCFSSNTGNVATGTINPYTIYYAGAFQGGLSVTTAGVVAVAAFCGVHWSQHESGQAIDIPYGTIVETVDEMCEWSDEHNEQLARFKVSDTPGSNSVYGVFVDWNIAGPDADDYPDDANIMALGAFVIRIAAGVTVKNGDLIESDGNGCGRVQADNIMRASTVAKITSTVHRHDYDDGSYVVPCTLHCG